MHKIIPTDEVRVKIVVPILVDQFGMPELGEITHHFGDSLCNLALNVWNRVIQIEKRPLDPRAVARFHNPRTGELDVRMVPFMDQLLGQPVLKDISFTHCRIDDDSLEDSTVSRLFLGRVYPNDLHIADVLFQDPNQPIPDDQRRYEYQFFKGLGLLPMTMDRIEQYARKQGCNFITLTAATEGHVPLFEKYGFTVEANEPGRMQRAMEKKLA